MESPMPHVYYTISELSSVRDIRCLKNLHVKTIGYMQGDRLHELKINCPQNATSESSILLDLSHVPGNICLFKPNVVFAILCTVEGKPMLTAKFVKPLDYSDEDLLAYNQYQLALRKKSQYFENLEALAQKDQAA